MSFPTVASTSQWTGGPTKNHKVTTPSGVSSGDLLLVFQANTPSGTQSFDAKWTVLTAPAAWNTLQICIAYAIADGTETGDLAFVTFPANKYGGAICLRITGYSGVPQDAGSYVQSAGSSTLDPPNLTPSGGALDYLWFVWACVGVAGDTVSALSSGYGNEIASPGSGISSLSYSLARRTANASSENPAALTWTTSGNTEGITACIAGVASAALARSFGIVI